MYKKSWFYIVTTLSLAVFLGSVYGIWLALSELAHGAEPSLALLIPLNGWMAWKITASYTPVYKRHRAEQLLEEQLYISSTHDNNRHDD